MPAILEALITRRGRFEAQRKQSADFMSTLSLPVAENVGALSLVLNGVNRNFSDVNFSLVGQRVLAHGQFEGPPRGVDFLIINNAKTGTPLRARALNYLNGELSRYFTSRSESSFRSVYESEAYRVVEICYGPEPTRFYITGKTWNDLHMLKAALDMTNERLILLNPRP